MMLEQKDLQGLLKRAYGPLKAAQFIVLTFGDKANPKSWLSEIQPLVTGVEFAGIQAIHLAFTYTGIEQLIPKAPDGSDPFLEPFAREFTEGMTHPTRRRILGDVGINDPSGWKWGNPNETHALLMLYAHPSEIEQLVIREQERLQKFGIQEKKLPISMTLPNDKEHFGFRDGIAQPIVDGFSNPDKGAKDFDELPTGEFILGYPNIYNKIPFSPRLADGFDFGKNGSYLVVRQLRQDVAGFWDFISKAVQEQPNLHGCTPAYLASKMVGRWPDGQRVLPGQTHYPSPPETDPADNNFGFQKTDAEGFGCPIGAHIRKSNPRDGFDGGNSDALELANRHRLLRRGRPYGKALVEDLNHEALISAKDDGENRGLYFMCFNANIGRQFEFVQQAWDNNQKFDGLQNDVDPLIGVLGKHTGNGNYVYHDGEMSIPHLPIRRRVQDIKQFVFVEGGAYFFLPGLAALEKLAQYR